MAAVFMPDQQQLQPVLLFAVNKRTAGFLAYHDRFSPFKSSADPRPGFHMRRAQRGLYRYLLIYHVCICFKSEISNLTDKKQPALYTECGVSYIARLTRCPILAIIKRYLCACSSAG